MPPPVWEIHNLKRCKLRQKEIIATVVLDTIALGPNKAGVEDVVHSALKTCITLGPLKEGTSPCDPTLAPVDVCVPGTPTGVSEVVPLADADDPDTAVGSEVCGPSPGLVPVVCSGKGPTVACKVGKPFLEITL